ncbi:DNA adenine methylase [Cellulosimicrobium sp. 72-3]|uniref:DNA adenine methylase n=1 Tax=Cellulosimicrobium sp. 72-3 TaxID=2731680 RepID=UPI00148ED85F|nr:DNA adenine methylase [Cellulosimicrobium sp. 72-3]
MAVDVREQEKADVVAPVPAAAPRPIWQALGAIEHPLALGRYQSPLRYPGAKSGLARVIGDLLKSAQASSAMDRIDLLVEPFAGGASTSLRLLGEGTVERAVLADADPLVASLWKVAAARTSELVERISSEHEEFVNGGGDRALARWDYWRAWAPAAGMSQATEELELATKCLFLNRTTFSGILHGRAGPIGGRKQVSKYTIGCRFNVAALTERLEYVGHLYEIGRIADVWCADWKETLNRVVTYYKKLVPNRVVAYLDPPYISKSWKLYRQSFDVEASRLGVEAEWTAGLQHHRLAQYLRTEARFRWILSYDYDDVLLDDPALYAAKAMHPSDNVRANDGVKTWRISKRVVGLNYSASSRTGRGAAKELLLTTLPSSAVPDDDRLRAIAEPRS